MFRGRIAWAAACACFISGGVMAQSPAARKVTGEVAVALTNPAASPLALPALPPVAEKVAVASVVKPAVLAPVIERPAPLAAAPDVAPAPAVTSVAAAPVPQARAEAVPVFRVRAGEMLSEVLNSWVGRGQMSVVWKSSNDYRLAADAHFTGSLMSALEQLTEVVAKTSPALRVRMYANGVIVVTEGEE
jgi:hypothetical protein